MSTRLDFIDQQIRLLENVRLTNLVEVGRITKVDSALINGMSAVLLSKSGQTEPH